MRVLQYILIVAGFICTALMTPVIAVETPVLTTDLSNIQISIGDSFELSINAQSQSPVRFTFPDDSLDLSPFTILQRRIEIPTENGSGSTETLILTLSIYKTGDFEIPTIPVKWVADDGSSGLISSEKQFVRVKSVLNPQEEVKPQPMKGPLSVAPRTYYIIRTFVIVFATVACVLILWLFLSRLKRKKIVQQLQKPEPLLPAHYVAFKKLEELKASNFLGKGDIRQFFIQLSEIAKEYVGRRFAFQALEHTTGEIRRDMHTLQMDSLIQSDFLAVLELADMVKFARFLPSDSQCRESLERVYKIVETTKEAESTHNMKSEPETEVGA